MNKIFPGIILIIVVGVVVYLAPWLSGFFTSGSLANFGPNASVFYFSNDAGLSFSSQDDGLMTSEAIDVVFAPDQSRYLITNQGVFEFNSQGQKWKRLKDDTGIMDYPLVVRSMVWSKAGDAFLAINKNGQGKIYYSSDGLKTLNEVYVTSQADSEIKDLQIDESGRIYFLSSEKIFGYSDNNGKTFRLMTHLDSIFERIVMSSNDNNVVYLWGAQLVYKSVDGGNNFSNLSVPFSGINDFFVANNGVIYSATDKGVYRSFDGGWSWVIMDSLLPKNLSSGAVAYNNEKKCVLAGFNGKLYISEDGVSWAIKTVGVNSINMIKINPFNANEVLVGMKK
ncbi:MAG TPA: hypothetical protein PLQ44_00750 [Candidatus Paceibacterota bacterium]|nr:hypothetical protein [Candidatus Paceibacterota bacterium]HPT40121.1 hypothetical protein [Candidatus Paceibacterota bacterium]